MTISLVINCVTQKFELSKFLCVCGSVMCEERVKCVWKCDVLRERCVCGSVMCEESVMCVCGSEKGLEYRMPVNVPICGSVHSPQLSI